MPRPRPDASTCMLSSCPLSARATCRRPPMRCRSDGRRWRSRRRPPAPTRHAGRSARRATRGRASTARRRCAGGRELAGVHREQRHVGPQQPVEIVRCRPSDRQAATAVRVAPPDAAPCSGTRIAPDEPRLREGHEADDCTHLDKIADVTPSGDGCDECLRIGARWVHLRSVRGMRSRRLCDQLAQPPRHRALPRHRPPDHPVGTSPARTGTAATSTTSCSSSRATTPAPSHP